MEDRTGQSERTQSKHPANRKCSTDLRLPDYRNCMLYLHNGIIRNWPGQIFSDQHLPLLADPVNSAIHFPADKSLDGSHINCAFRIGSDISRLAIILTITTENPLISLARFFAA